MKILYDHLCFNSRFGGVSKYFIEVIKRLPPKSFTLSLKFSNNEYIANFNIIKFYQVLPNVFFRGKAKLLNYLNRPFSILHLLFTKYDIYHQTHYDLYALPYISKRSKFVTTIYDLNYITIPQYYSHKNISLKAQKLSAERADKIIAISHNTKKDLIKYWGLNEEKIAVIHLGVDKEKKNSLTTVRIFEKPYLLYVGSREPYKNFNNLVKAFISLSVIYPELYIVCTGNAFDNNEVIYFSELGLKDKIYSFSASENQISCLYRDAELFVYPSFYEGFGMPLLEAMVFDCPVVCSNTSCFPEVAGNAAQYFDPNSVDDMVNNIEKVLSDSSLRQILIANGRKRLELFSWDKTVLEHLLVYKSLLS